LFVLNAGVDQFRTGWFVESVVSASLIVLVIRSRRPFFRSRPGKYLFLATLLVVGSAVVFPYTPLSSLFDMQPLPMSFLFMLGAIVLLYIAGAEVVKKIFYRLVAF
jgi:Mg2+-importing ATPase